MTWVSSVDDGLRFSPLKAGTASANSAGTEPNIAETSAMLAGIHGNLDGQLKACGVTVTITTAVTANVVMANIEAKYLTSWFLAEGASRANQGISPRAQDLISQASAFLDKKACNHAYWSALSATVDASYARRFSVSGFFGVSAAQTTQSAFNDVTFSRRSEF